ncbi:MAG: pseudouridine synthase, partial [Sphingomonadales bacterium]
MPPRPPSGPKGPRNRPPPTRRDGPGNRPASGAAASPRNSTGNRPQRPRRDAGESGLFSRREDALADSARPDRPPRDRPDHARLERTRPERTRPDRAAPNRRAATDQAGPRRDRPDRARAAPAPRAATAPAPAPAVPVSHGDVPAQRIAKLLARAGVGSRRDIERMVAEGRVALDGTPLTSPALNVTSLNGITVDGHPVAGISATRVFAFHKPPGFLTTTRDPGGRPTVMDILPPGLPRLVPVGRLDMNTEGLLLLTNDGALKRALELPINAVPRLYRVRAYGEITQKQLDELMHGITVEGVHYGSIDADITR